MSRSAKIIFRNAFLFLIDPHLNKYSILQLIRHHWIEIIDQNLIHYNPLLKYVKEIIIIQTLSAYPKWPKYMTEYSRSIVRLTQTEHLGMRISHMIHYVNATPSGPTKIATMLDRASGRNITRRIPIITGDILKGLFVDFERRGVTREQALERITVFGHDAFVHDKFGCLETVLNQYHACISYDTTIRFMAKTALTDENGEILFKISSEQLQPTLSGILISPLSSFTPYTSHIISRLMAAGIIDKWRETFETFTSLDGRRASTMNKKISKYFNADTTSRKKDELQKTRMDDKNLNNKPLNSLVAFSTLLHITTVSSGVWTWNYWHYFHM